MESHKITTAKACSHEISHRVCQKEPDQWRDLVCSSEKENNEVLQNFFGKPHGKWSLGRPRT
jgi:hypothetical protein